MRRRGTSLVELMVVMSACVVVLTLSAELIHRAMHIQSRTTAVISAERSAQRLAAAFRRDVQDATQQLDGADDATLLRFEVGSEEIEYRKDGPTIERQVSREETVHAKEQFVFPQELNVRIDELSNGLIKLSLESSMDVSGRDGPETPSQAFVTPVHLEATAVLGKNARFVATGSDEVSP